MQDLNAQLRDARSTIQQMEIERVRVSEKALATASMSEKELSVLRDQLEEARLQLAKAEDALKVRDEEISRLKTDELRYVSLGARK